MKDKIKWPTGNRLDLCIPLRKITVTEEGTQFGEYIPSQAAVVMVYLVGNYASYEFTPRIEDNKLYISDNGELKPGVYAIDVRIQEPERKLRSFRCGELEIVRETRQLALGDFVLNNNVTLDADAFIFGEGPSAYEVAVRDGYTGTKEEWLESMRGKEGRGIADIVALPTGAFRILLTDGSAYVTPILKGEQGVSVTDISVTGITTTEVICTITMSDGTTRTVNLPRGEKGEQGVAGEDGRGIQSVVMNNDYTITFSYTDGTSYTTPQALRGEQGDNGKDGQDGRGISGMSLDDDNHLTVSYTDGTSYTTPQSLQGESGVSITDFEQVGENATMTFFNIYFSNGNISQIALPKGEQGDRGEQGPQGPKGDTVVLGEVGEYKLYNISGTATDGAMTQDATTKSIAANTGYYECSTAAGTAAKVAVGDNEALYTLQKGGSIKVKMTNANAAASGVTLKIGSAAATPLYYNGEAVSASNTWEAGEVISVYFDGTVYQASNAQGGGGKAEKIKYDNSASGLVAENVQGALDEVAKNITFKQIPYDTQKNGALVGTQNAKWSLDNNYVRTHRVVQVHGEKYVKVIANSDYVAAIGFLKTYTQPTVNNQQADFCDGYVTFVTTEVGETQVIPIPSDCNYIVIDCNYNASNMQRNYEPIYVGLSFDAQEVYNEVETIDRDKLASGELLLNETEDGYYYSDAQGNKTSFQNGRIYKYKIRGIVNKIHLTVCSGSLMYSLFKDIDGNIIGSFMGSRDKGMNINQDISLPKGTMFVEISSSKAYPIYIYVLDRTVDVVIDLAAPMSGKISLTNRDEGHYISSSTGNISSLASYNIDYFNIIGTVDIVHIRGGIGTSAYILFYDSNNSILKYVHGDTANTFDENISVPSSCASFAVSYSTRVPHIIEVKKSIVEQVATQQEEIIYLTEKFVDFRGKKIGLIGDSIAANGGFITYACQILGASFKNAAIGGWYLGNKENKGIYKQVDGVSPSTTQLDGDEDLIVIFAGTNDFGGSLTIGEPYITDVDGHRSYNTDANTTCGGLALAIQTLYTKYNGYIPIIICTPLQRCSTGGSSWDKNSINNYMDDYIEAIMSVANYYGIPVCDFYHCNMNPNIPETSTLYFNDGLHPNVTGHLIMGQILAHFLANNAFTLT